MKKNPYIKKHKKGRPPIENFHRVNLTDIELEKRDILKNTNYYLKLEKTLKQFYSQLSDLFNKE